MIVCEGSQVMLFSVGRTEFIEGKARFVAEKVGLTIDAEYNEAVKRLNSVTYNR